MGKVGEKSVLMEYVESIVIAVLLAMFIMTFIGRSYVVDGSSMVPTLHNGERLLVDKLTYRFSEPKRGDIIVFKFPANPKYRYIKRVIGIPGDKIMIENGSVYLNGVRLEEPYVSEPVKERFGPFEVPEDRVFVLGDNRNNSQDSRYTLVGYVPYKLIEGRALIRYWPLTRIDLIQRPDIFSQFATAQ
ncbi:MAG: signal peptidase I [Firmicutes bacterium]|nr:signal peptidase I [Bacillota bacterium]